MTSQYLKLLTVGLVLAVAPFEAANAATINNADADAQTLIVTEDGVKNEIVVGAGQTITLCSNGCFITMPNGDRAALSGNENVTISGGEAVISE